MSGETKGRHADREGSCCERKKTDRTEEKCTYSFTCEDLVKVLFVFLQFAVTKAAGLNPHFNSAGRFSSGVAWRVPGAQISCRSAVTSGQSDSRRLFNG